MADTTVPSDSVVTRGMLAYISLFEEDVISQAPVLGDCLGFPLEAGFSSSENTLDRRVLRSFTNIPA